MINNDPRIRGDIMLVGSLPLRLALGNGLGINRVAKLVGVSNGTVQRIKGEMEAA